MQNNITIVVAMSKDGVIGLNNKLPWHLPSDLKHFKQLTLDKSVIMGRKTFESIVKYLGKPLPRRNNIVLSSSLSLLNNDSVQIYQNFESLLLNINEHEEYYIIGGSQVYNQAMQLNMANKMIISHVNISCDGDAFFPTIDESIWSIFSAQEVTTDEIPFSIKTYHKIKA
jgi:dihydrofolate reductase